MDTHNTDSRLEAVIQINELLAYWHRTSNHQQQLQKIRDYLATTPIAGNERTAEEMERMAEDALAKIDDVTGIFSDEYAKAGYIKGWIDCYAATAPSK